jgi:putative FmdB family regulatory protein
MPVYVYKCEVCGVVFEKRCHVNENLSGLVCPNNHTQLQRVYTSPNIIFKGPGFYVTDSRSKTSKSKT